LAAASVARNERKRHAALFQRTESRMSLRSSGLRHVVSG